VHAIELGRAHSICCAGSFSWDLSTADVSDSTTFKLRQITSPFTRSVSVKTKIRRTCFKVFQPFRLTRKTERILHIRSLRASLHLKIVPMPASTCCIPIPCITPSDNYFGDIIRCHPRCRHDDFGIIRWHSTIFFHAMVQSFTSSNAGCHV